MVVVVVGVVVGIGVLVCCFQLVVLSKSFQHDHYVANMSVMSL